MFKYLSKHRLTCTLLTSILFIGSLVSCTKFIEVGPPNDKLESNTVFADSVSASSTLTGIYSTFMAGNTGFLGYKSVLSGLEADDLSYAGLDNSLLEFANNNLQINNARINTFWTELYAQIYRCNSIIEGVTKSTGISSSAKLKLKAEVFFVRAFCYFYLVNSFGQVPLITETTYPNTATVGRSRVQDIYKQMIADLDIAKAGLPDTYSTPNRARPNKWTAAALLSRCYLYTKDYVAAEAEASAVIQRTDLYSINPDLSAVFKKESMESIWQLAPVLSSYNTFDGYLFTGSPGNIPLFTLTEGLYNSFSTNDKRKSSWIGSQTVNVTTYYYPNKYKINNGSAGNNIEFEVVFRLAEQYLIRAEARAMQNNLTGTNSASSDINIIRNRAGLNDIAATTQETILVELEAEKRREYFAEWGHRWWDLKRWPSNVSLGQTRADDVLTLVKGANWQPTDILYPIPFDQIQLNGNLTQNDGYAK